MGKDGNMLLARRFGLGLIAAQVLLQAQAAAFAQERNQQLVLDEVRASPIIKTYREGFGVGGNSSYISGGKLSHPLAAALHEACSRSFFECDYSWKALAGKPVEGAAQVLLDGVHMSRWAGEHGCTKNPMVCGPDGTQWSFTIDGPRPRAFANVGVISAEGLAVYQPEGAAEAIAKTVADETQQAQLWQEYTATPYDSLYFLGAKEHLPVLLKGMWYGKKDRPHLVTALWHLDAWTLSPEQLEGVASGCAQVLADTAEAPTTKTACIRYLGIVGAPNREARAFIANLAGSGDVQAIRALAGLIETSSRKRLEQNLLQAYREKATRIKKGNKYEEKKTDSWRIDPNAVPSAIALFGMGDATAAKAIAYWLSMEERGSSMELTDNGGFTGLARDLNFADPKGKAKLLALTSNAWKAVEKAAQKNTGLQNELFSAALGLSQAGDKAALAHLMEYIQGDLGREADVQKILGAWGGAPGEQLKPNSDAGIGRFPVGKGGYSVEDAAKVVASIKARLPFWSSSGLKAVGVRTILEIEARRAAVTKQL
jgi:hypothetical protein